jgi:hypothetical protein
VGEAQELEGFRFPLPASLASFGGIPPELQQARVVRVQRQAESAQPFP